MTAASTPEELLALAERVEKAEGPDRYLDWDIDVVRRPSEYYGIERADELGHPLEWLSTEDLPAYTASLDAAMSLVPEAHEWSVNWAGNSVAEVRELPDGEPHYGHAATPALALTAAALKSRAGAL